MKYPIDIACIIDDDDMYVSLITKVIDIKNLAQDLIVFKNGKEALEYFIGAFHKKEDRCIPQVILLDLNMPVMDGWEFLTELTKHNFPNLTNTTLYIVSSSINPVDLERAKEIIMVRDFIIKPITPEALSAVFVSKPV